MNRASTFIILILFVIFLTISLVTLNSDFITLSIFCFIVFFIDYINILFFEKIEVNCERKIILISKDDDNFNDQSTPEKKDSRFIDGQEAIIRVSIKINSKSKFFFNVLERIPERLLVNSSNSDLISLNLYHNPEDSFEFEYSYKINLVRGSYEFEPIFLNIYSLFFLSNKKIKLDSDLKLIVYPKEPIDINLPIGNKKVSIYAGIINSKKAGNGLNFFGVRQYYDGDKLNLINWKHSAKNSELYVNEFEKETNTDISIILDCRKKSYKYENSDIIFEKGVEAAYSIAKSMLKTQNRVGFLQFGAFFNHLRPSYGKYQLEKIAYLLANISISDIEDFWELDAIPEEIIPAQSLIFLITTLSEEDIPHILKFHKKKYRMVIIALNTIEFDYNILNEDEKIRLQKAYLLAKSLRKVTIETARKTGAVVLDYDCTKLFNLFIEENLHYLKELSRKAGRI